MKKNRTMQGYLLNTVLLALLFAGFQLLTSAVG